MTRIVRTAWPSAVLLALALAAPAPSPAAGDAPAGLVIGAPIPMADVGMKNVDGRELTIAKSAGKKGTLVIFICNHCPWVKMWQSRIAETGNAAMRMGVGVIAVNGNDPAAYPEDAFDVMVKRAREVGYRFPYVVDATSGVARAFGATHTPEAFLFDATGALVYHGAVDDNARQPDQVKSHWLADAVSALASGKPVPVAETKAFGCSIKYREKKAD